MRQFSLDVVLRRIPLPFVLQCGGILSNNALYPLYCDSMVQKNLFDSQIILFPAVIAYRSMAHSMGMHNLIKN